MRVIITLQKEVESIEEARTLYNRIKTTLENNPEIIIHGQVTDTIEET